MNLKIISTIEVGLQQCFKLVLVVPSSQAKTKYLTITTKKYYYRQPELLKATKLYNLLYRYFQAFETNIFKVIKGIGPRLKALSIEIQNLKPAFKQVKCHIYEVYLK